MIVGISSNNPQSGKSTVREVFEHRGYTALSLASPVKESLLVVLNDSHVLSAVEYLWGNWKDRVIPELGVTGGKLMSSYAMNMRSLNEDIWLNILLNKIYNSPESNFVIDDMRFPNEFDSMDYTVNVIRPNANENHGREVSSEGQLRHYNYDFTISNDGSLQDLRKETWGICDQLEEK